jgi:hypothetical protein
MKRGYVGWVALSCLALGSVSCKPQQPDAAGKDSSVKEGTAMTGQTGSKDATAQSLECTVSVPPRLKVGEPVPLLFKLTNRSAQPLFVLEWHTPLEGLLANVLEVTRDGAPVPYEGPMVKRGAPGADDYAAIASGASVEAEIDVSLAYNLKQPGTYRITPRANLMDVATQKEGLPRALDQFQERAIQCPTVETVIVAP